MKNNLLISLILFFILINVHIDAYCNEMEKKMNKEIISFNVVKQEHELIFGEEMSIEIIIKNHSNYPVKLHKNYYSQDDLLFKLKLNEKHLVNEEMKRSYNLISLRMVKIGDSLPESFITLKPGEEYKEKVNIANMFEELVKGLGLKPGKYNVRLVYTMWVQILKEKPEYAKNKDGTIREWESNEFEIKLVEKKNP